MSRASIFRVSAQATFTAKYKTLARSRHGDFCPCAADVYDTEHKQNKFPESRNIYREEIENAPSLCASALHTKVSTAPI
jgi:hypothetical protein